LSSVKRTPPAPPPTQIFSPSLLTALRALFLSAKSVSAVSVLMTPAPLTRPMVRGKAVAFVSPMLAVPSGAL
jgi:hypothetical protein